MTWPNEATKTHLDQGTDDPKQARGELATLVDKFNEMRNHVAAFVRPILERTSAAQIRGDLGLGTAAVKNTGTSGDAVPLLDQLADFSSAFQLSGTITPAALTGNVNNYNPSGLSSATALRLSSNAERTITGLAGGASGRLVVLTNVGDENIVLAHGSTSSSAANRFLFAGENDLRLSPGVTIMLRYDGTSSRWRLAAGGGSVGDFTRATEQATTSGSSRTFSGIPPEVSEVVFSFDGVSLSGAGGVLLQIGDSGGIETSGYNGGATAGILIPIAGSDRKTFGAVALYRQSGNKWVFHGSRIITPQLTTASTPGTKALSGELTQLRLITTDGTFTDGAVNIMYR